ncbi:MAG: YraN family protein [Caldilineae bacterium]|nr:MAG: YraN family protein [Caldilineae bacterium]
MTSHRKATGAYGEQLAAAYLNRQGYEIVARNWRCPAGEMDIIARQGETLVFVEVRTRRGTRLGSPEESITPAKQARLVDIARTYLAEMDCAGCDWRIDVIAIVLNRRNQIARFNHLRWAVGEM